MPNTNVMYRPVMPNEDSVCAHQCTGSSYLFQITHNSQIAVSLVPQQSCTHTLHFMHAGPYWLCHPSLLQLDSSKAVATPEYFVRQHRHHLFLRWPGSAI